MFSSDYKFMNLSLDPILFKLIVLCTCTHTSLLLRWAGRRIGGLEFVLKTCMFAFSQYTTKNNCYKINEITFKAIISACMVAQFN